MFSKLSKSLAREMSRETSSDVLLKKLADSKESRESADRTSRWTRCKSLVLRKMSKCLRSRVINVLTSTVEVDRTITTIKSSILTKLKASFKVTTRTFVLKSCAAQIMLKAQRRMFSQMASQLTISDKAPWATAIFSQP